MNHRERVLAALEHRSPDRPPRDLGGTTATGIHPTAYLALKQYLKLPGEAHYLSARAQLAEVELPVLDRLGIDFLPVIPKGAGLAPVLDENRAYVDRWGIERRLPKDAGHYYVSHPPLIDAETLTDLDAFHFPEPNLDYRELAETAANLRQHSDRALVLNPEVGFLHQAQFLRGFDHWLMDLAGDPVFAANLLDRVLEIWLAETQAMIDQVGAMADVVIYADDIALQNGLMFSPRTYQTLIRPRQKRIFDMLKGSGLKVLYHSCGSVGSLIGDLVDMGVDAINPVQVSALGMNDTVALKRQWGKHLTFWGGIDSQSVLPRGSVAEVQAEVSKRLDDLAGDGGFVLAGVHDIQPEVPPENLCRMFDAATIWEKSQR
jgi:uroporphyrinogen decarboxylase